MSVTDASNSGYIIAASASDGGGGVVTLPIKRRIVDNDFDASSGDNAIMLHARCTDTGDNTYSITMIIETWGRWHAVNSL